MPVKNVRLNRLFHQPFINGFRRDTRLTPVWVPGDFEGDFGTALQILIGYLSDTWKNFRRDANPRFIAEMDLDESNNGYHDFAEQLAGMPFLRVQVDIVSVPDDQDIYWGNPEILHCGWFAFGRKEDNTNQDPTGIPVFGITISEPSYSHLKYLNFGSMSFYPESPEETGFMVKLKAGVKAKMRVFGGNYAVFEEVDCTSTAPASAPDCDAHPDNWTRFEPPLGAWCPPHLAVTGSFSFGGNPFVDIPDITPQVPVANQFDKGQPTLFKNEFFAQTLPNTTVMALSTVDPNVNPLAVIGFAGFVGTPCPSGAPS